MQWTNPHLESRMVNPLQMADSAWFFPWSHIGAPLLGLFLSPPGEVGAKSFRLLFETRCRPRFVMAPADPWRARNNVGKHHSENSLYLKNLEMCPLPLQCFDMRLFGDIEQPARWECMCQAVLQKSQLQTATHRHLRCPGTMEGCRPRAEEFLQVSA